MGWALTEHSSGPLSSQVKTSEKNSVLGEMSKLSSIQLNGIVDSKDRSGWLGPWWSLISFWEVKHFIQDLVKLRRSSPSQGCQGVPIHVELLPMLRTLGRWGSCWKAELGGDSKDLPRNYCAF